MDYLQLGNSGLQVSRLCLGCMTYGEPGSGQHSWTLTEADSRPYIRAALEAGINFFDTANAYSEGSSEEITGRALRDYARRDEVVIATKCFLPWSGKPNCGGLSRKAIFQAIDDSLARLGTDYIDLYQIHRWDDHTPIEETLEALHDLVKAGKVRYLGASSMFAWQFAKALFTADRHGWTRFVSMQNHLNLLDREEEREMLPLCRDQGIGVIPWSPLARGRLAREEGTEATERSGSDAFGNSLYGEPGSVEHEIRAAVGELAVARGVSRAEVALAWVLQTPGVTAPIIGASKPGHLQAALAALELQLEEDEVARLQQAYQPRLPSGFR